MAGLSDMSMGDINKVHGNDSMADYSMASLNEDSMANIDDSGYKPPTAKGSQQFRSGTTQEDSSDMNEENMLDGLKQ